MSYKPKTRSNRKTNKYKTSKNSRASKQKTTTKRTSYGNSKSKDIDIDSSKLLSLSPFYSFSSHWSHITRQYLCLSTWGTCMGGINEQYDDIMDQEAAIPLVEDNYKRAISNWNKKKAKYDKYNKGVERYNKEQEIEAMRANQGNEAMAYDDSYNNNNYNYNDNEYNASNMYQQQEAIINDSKSIYLSVAHKKPEWQYMPHSDSDTSSSSEEEQENNYKTAAKKVMKSETYNDDNSDNNNKYSGHYADDEEYKDEQQQQQQQYTQSIDNKYLLSPKQDGQSENTEDDSTELTPKEHHSKRNVLSGRSFGRKLDMFEQAVTTKRRMTIEDVEWKESHHSKGSTKSFQSPENDGVQYIEQYTYSPAAHGVHPHMPRKVSTRDFTKHMKKMEDPQSIVTNDNRANASATDQIKFFTMLSTEHSHND